VPLLGTSGCSLTLHCGCRYLEGREGGGGLSLLPHAATFRHVCWLERVIAWHARRRTWSKRAGATAAPLP
jgi:hypothetical protein